MKVFGCEHVSTAADHFGHRESDGIGLPPPVLGRERRPPRQGTGGVITAGSSAVEETETLSVTRRSPHLDALARRWSEAFETARSALRAAGPYLGAQELGERSRRLVEERSEVARLLESLARELQAHSLLAAANANAAYAANPAIRPART